MTQYVATDEGSGEKEVATASSSSSSSPSSGKPTLKEFLWKEIGENADEIHTKMRNIGMREMDPLIFSDENDLNELCQALELSFVDKMKFKAGIRKLKQSLQAPQQHSIVTISSHEQCMIDQINLAIKQCNDIQQIFEQQFNVIDDHIADKKTKIDVQIDDNIKLLQNRKTMLHQQLDEWKSVKLEGMNKEIANIVEYDNKLKATKKAIDDLLRKSGVAKRDKKIKEIVDAVFKGDDKYKMYQDIKLLQQYIINKTKMIDVVFQNQMDMKQLASYGEINKNVKSDLFNLPSIVLEDLVKEETDHNGYKVKLNWQFISNEEEKANDFTVKYAEHGNNDNNNDEKKEEMNWITMNDPKIKQEIENKYSAVSDELVQYNKTYTFMVEMMMDKPLSIPVQSNMKSIMTESLKLDLSKEEQIPLKIHSHKGHDSGCPPENILKSNNKFYLSTRKQITNDWIIFSIDNNKNYYPTKLEVKTREHGGGNGFSMKRFRLKIGNTFQWITLNDQLFVASDNKELIDKFQTFQLDIVQDNNFINNEKALQWKSIKYKQYKEFKLEILDNYGGSYIKFIEFKIFGVPS